jgi:hypothetical protein
VDKSTLRAALDTYEKRFEAQSFGEWSKAFQIFAEAASMLEKLLPGEDGEFSEELVAAIERLELTAQDRDQFGNLTGGWRYVATSEVLQAIVDTLTDTKEGE